MTEHCGGAVRTHVETVQDSRVRSRKPRRGFSIVPFFGDLVVLTRLVRDPRSHVGYKALAIFTILYVLWPLDLVPEAIMPAVAWIDDVGIVLAIRLVLGRVLDAYRYPLFAKPVTEPGAQFASG